jgi:hypothetical protein
VYKIIPVVPATWMPIPPLHLQLQNCCMSSTEFEEMSGIAESSLVSSPRTAGNGGTRILLSQPIKKPQQPLRRKPRPIAPSPAQLSAPSKYQASRFLNLPLRFSTTNSSLRCVPPDPGPSPIPRITPISSKGSFDDPVIARLQPLDAAGERWFKHRSNRDQFADAGPTSSADVLLCTQGEDWEYAEPITLVKWTLSQLLKAMGLCEGWIHNGTGG